MAKTVFIAGRNLLQAFLAVIALQKNISLTVDKKHMQATLHCQNGG